MPAVNKASNGILYKICITGLVWLWMTVAVAAPPYQSTSKPPTNAEQSRPCGNTALPPQGQSPQRSSPKAPPSQGAPKSSFNAEKSRPCGEEAGTPQNPTARGPHAEIDKGLGGTGLLSPTAPSPYPKTEQRPYPSVDRSREVDTEWVVLPSQFSSWRPYSNGQVLVTLGMTKGEVLLKAGPPALDEMISLGTDGHPTRSVWTYIRTGFNASITTLTFQGNILVRIDTKLSN
jgi:hypothetical protein